MKTLEETVIGMLSDDWKERLIAEIEQCDIRMYHLGKHLVAIGEDSPEYSLLEEQYNAMDKYLSLLVARATVFDVHYTLPSVKDLEAKETAIPNLFPINRSNRELLWMFILFYLMMEGESK